MLNSQNLQAYFAGPVNVNNAIGLYKNSNIGFSSFFLDIVNNMPVVNHWFDTKMATVNQYNYYIGRSWNGLGDQIIPLVGQSLIYFSTFFAPLLSCISIVLLRLFDRKYVSSSSLDVYYYAFSSTWTGVSIRSF